MDAMSQNNCEIIARDLGKLLDEHKAADVLVMDMRLLNFWTDFFVIATVTSNTHLAGLERHIKEFAREKELEFLRRSKKPEKADTLSEEWQLLDLGVMVIHLMSAKTRSFFELERLWSTASLVFDSREHSPNTHSSKSS